VHTPSIHVRVADSITALQRYGMISSQRSDHIEPSSFEEVRAHIATLLEGYERGKVNREVVASFLREVMAHDPLRYGDIEHELSRIDERIELKRSASTWFGLIVGMALAMFLAGAPPRNAAVGGFVAGTILAALHEGSESARLRRAHSVGVRD
jgi:hypothetical protein